MKERRRPESRAGLLALALLIVLSGAYALHSATMTMTASYPSPTGVYHQLITTGKNGTNTVDTTLNRDSGNTILAPSANGKVGIGTTSPASKLAVSGDATVSGAVTVGGNVSVTGTLSAASVTGAVYAP
jgi:hypothetical protein